MKSEMEKLHERIEDIEIAMMTTRAEDGHLRSRAMATQKRAAGADLWFVTEEGSPKLADLAIQRLRESIDAGGTELPVDERRLTRARRAVEKAAGLLREPDDAV